MLGCVETAEAPARSSEEPIQSPPVHVEAKGEEAARARPDGAPAPQDPGVPARRGPDRRVRSTPRFSRYTFFGGRRRAPRRAEEREGSYVDVYDPALLAAVLWIALMNAADSFFTIVHLQHGGSEVNPIAAILLSTGRTGFVVAKSAVIGLALVVLCLHKNFRLARLGLWIAAGAYTLLCGYHLLLFAL